MGILAFLSDKGKVNPGADRQGGRWPRLSSAKGGQVGGDEGVVLI